jgi:hypothetical protein
MNESVIFTVKVLPRQIEPPCRHRRRVHEDDVDARDVHGHPRRQHDAGLRLNKE